MEPSLIINIILFVGAAQGFLLSAATLGIKRGNRTANILLAAFIFFFSMMIFFHSVHGLGENPNAPLSPDENSFHNLFFIFGPLIYFYTVALTNKSFTLKWKHAAHLLPTLFGFIIDFLFIEMNAPEKLHKLFTGIIIGLVVAQLSLCLFFSFKALGKHSEELKKSFSSIEKINLDWLRFLISAQIIIWPIALVVEILAHNHDAWNFIWILVSIFIYIMGYKGLKQPAIFTGALPNSKEDENEPKKKYEKSTLTNEMADEYFKKLIKFMEIEKIYLETNLTLPVLAGRLAMSSHHLSQIINEKRNQNFFEFVNSFRIEEARKHLSDPNKMNLNISAIAFESGFNTLSSFNSVFKKFTRQTPSQFRNNS